MQRTCILREAGLYVAGFALFALSGCSNVGSNLSSVTGPKNDWSSPRVALGRPSAERASQSVAVAPAAAVQTVDHSPKINDQTRARVALATAEMLENAGNLPAAQVQYEEALKFEPKMLKASLALARVYARLGRPDAALKTYQAAEKHHRKNAAIYNDKGLLMAESKDWPAAIESLRQAVKLEPSNSKFRNNLGLALAASGAYKDAWKEFREAVGPGPAHYNIAVMLIQSGRTDEARGHLELAIREMPQLADARNLLDRMNAIARQAELVGQDAELAHHVEPASAETMDLITPAEQNADTISAADIEKIDATAPDQDASVLTPSVEADSTETMPAETISDGVPADTESEDAAADTASPAETAPEPAAEPAKSPETTDGAKTTVSTETTDGTKKSDSPDAATTPTAPKSSTEPEIIQMSYQRAAPAQRQTAPESRSPRRPAPKWLR